MLEVTGDIYCMGDPHGEWDITIEKIIDLENCSLFILGDNGFGWFNRDPGNELLRLQEVAKENNITIYFLRGNHDNPDIWHNEIRRKKVTEKFPNLIVLEEQVISINGHYTLILGGGISIDRFDRRLGKSWWADEKLLIPELSKEELSKIDTIFSHTCFKPDKRQTNNAVCVFAMYDKNLLSDLKEEQEIYKQLVQNICEHNSDLKTLKIMYGHFHIDAKYGPIEINGKNVELDCLGIQSIKKVEYY